MPQLEAWELVYVKSDFLTSTHGRNNCTVCHEGDETTNDKIAAHVNLVATPSEEADKYCGGCHAGQVADDHTSLHRTQEGYYTLFEKRSGFDLRNDEHLSEEFGKECGKCHTTCGQCHVSRPKSVSGGFIAGHEFRRTPNMVNNCTACHGSRVGAEYRGENDGYTADVHWQPGAKRCEYCHQSDQLHGPGFLLETRYDDRKPNLPKCEDCHSDVKDDNAYHSWHWSNAENNSSASHLQCQVCHSQDYKNCNACHVGGDGITGSSYMKFKIGKNHLQSDQKPYDYVVVRHIPIAPTTFSAWGVSDLSEFDAEPTWKYATPHNIRRWTARTDTTGNEGNCGLKCHNNSNKELDTYLRSDDMEFDYDQEPNKNVIIENN